MRWVSKIVPGLVLGGFTFALCRCGSTTHQYEAYDNSVELQLEPSAADAATPETGVQLPENTGPTPIVTNADAAPVPVDEASPALLEKVPDGTEEDGALKAVGPQPTGDDEVKSSGKGIAREIRLYSDGRCRSQLLCPKPMDAHNSSGRYCSEPKPAPCTPKLKKAWAERKAAEKD